MKTALKTITFLGIIFLSSCAIMPICRSTKTDNIANSDHSQTTFFDRNTNLEFRVSNDENSLQTVLIFDSLALQKIADKGFYIYFDTKGKKKKENSLKIFPDKNDKNGIVLPDKPTETGKSSFNRAYSLNKDCEKKYTSAIWKTKDNIYAFDILFSIHPINVKTKALDNGFWQVCVAIPLSELSPDPILSLSIGVETPKVSQGNNLERPAMQGDMGTAMQEGMTGPPGGRMPEAGPTGNGPGGMGSGRTGGENFSSSNSQLSSWILVYL